MQKQQQLLIQNQPTPVPSQSTGHKRKLSNSPNQKQHKPRERWTPEEHQLFLEALKKYGRQWRLVSQHIKTKSAVQIRSHAQKFFTKLEKEGKSREVMPGVIMPPPRPKRKSSVLSWSQPNSDDHKTSSDTAAQTNAGIKLFSFIDGQESVHDTLKQLKDQAVQNQDNPKDLALAAVLSVALATAYTVVGQVFSAAEKMAVVQLEEAVQRQVQTSTDQQADAAPSKPFNGNSSDNVITTSHSSQPPSNSVLTTMNPSPVPAVPTTNLPSSTTPQPNDPSTSGSQPNTTLSKVSGTDIVGTDTGSGSAALCGPPMAQRMGSSSASVLTPNPSIMSTIHSSLQQASTKIHDQGPSEHTTVAGDELAVCANPNKLTAPPLQPALIHKLNNNQQPLAGADSASAQRTIPPRCPSPRGVIAKAIPHLSSIGAVDASCLQEVAHLVMPFLDSNARTGNNNHSRQLDSTSSMPASSSATNPTNSAPINLPDFQLLAQKLCNLGHPSITNGMRVPDLPLLSATAESGVTALAGGGGGGSLGPAPHIDGDAGGPACEKGKQIVPNSSLNLQHLPNRISVQNGMVANNMADPNEAVLNSMVGSTVATHNDMTTRAPTVDGNPQTISAQLASNTQGSTMDTAINENESGPGTHGKRVRREPVLSSVSQEWLLSMQQREGNRQGWGRKQSRTNIQ